MTESDFNKRLKTLSLIALKVIIKGTGLKTKSELLLWKFYIEGKSYYEIADDLGIFSRQSLMECQKGITNHY